MTITTLPLPLAKGEAIARRWCELLLTDPKGAEVLDAMSARELAEQVMAITSMDPT